MKFLTGLLVFLTTTAHAGSLSYLEQVQEAKLVLVCDSESKYVSVSIGHTPLEFFSDPFDANPTIVARIKAGEFRDRFSVREKEKNLINLISGKYDGKLNSVLDLRQGLQNINFTFEGRTHVLSCNLVNVDG